MNQDEIITDRRIDPEQLDIEAVQQADLYGKWAERAARAKGEADRLEWEAELLEARLQGQCRNNPDKFGISGSATEAAIKAAVKCHVEYVAAIEKFHAARLDSGMLDRAEKAMAQKKGMIEELVKLHGQQYFAGPKVPHDIVSAWQAHRTARDEAVGTAIRENVRRRIRTEGVK